MKTPRSNHGYTIVEILYAILIMSLLLTGVTSFFIQNLKGIYASDQRLKLAAQMKRFSNELMVHASRSNQFIIFKSPTLADFDASDGTDRQVINANATPLLHPGGDFVVFIYYEIPKPSTATYYRISSMVGYYLTASSGGVGPLQKVEITPTTASTSLPEDILNACWNTSSSKFNAVTGYNVTVTSCFPLVRGLAMPEIVDNTAVTGTTTPRLFYVTAARNVVISGQVYTSTFTTEKIATSDWKTYTNTFSFNITPRT